MAGPKDQANQAIRRAARKLHEADTGMRKNGAGVDETKDLVNDAMKECNVALSLLDAPDAAPTASAKSKK